MERESDSAVESIIDGLDGIETRYLLATPLDHEIRLLPGTTDKIRELRQLLKDLEEEVVTYPQDMPGLENLMERLNACSAWIDDLEYDCRIHAQDMVSFLVQELTPNDGQMWQQVRESAIELVRRASTISGWWKYKDEGIAGGAFLAAIKKINVPPRPMIKDVSQILHVDRDTIRPRRDAFLEMEDCAVQEGRPMRIKISDAGHSVWLESLEEAIDAIDEWLPIVLSDEDPDDEMRAVSNPIPKPTSVDDLQDYADAVSGTQLGAIGREQGFDIRVTIEEDTS